LKASIYFQKLHLAGAVVLPSAD